MSPDRDGEAEDESGRATGSDAGTRSKPTNGTPGPSVADWPVDLDGVTESVVATLGPDGRWNLAALGLHAPERAGEPVRARTWGRTRTRRNFEREGAGVVQFVTDPRDFVDAALGIREEAEPVVDSADAWVRVEAEWVGAGEDGGTAWVDWHLRPVESVVRSGGVRTFDRGTAAVIEATVLASRLGVDAYDDGTLCDRLAYFADVVDHCGGSVAREAFARIDAETGWRDACGNERF